jgi:arsenate reductase
VSVTLFGIKNCDTMKKARAWLEARGVEYAFHDYKTQGIDGAHLDRWFDEVGWEALLNRAGTTYRNLPEKDKQEIDARKARALMVAHPTLIKRPVLESGAKLLVGFRPEIYEQALIVGNKK